MHTSFKVEMGPASKAGLFCSGTPQALALLQPSAERPPRPAAQAGTAQEARPTPPPVQSPAERQQQQQPSAALPPADQQPSAAVPPMQPPSQRRQQAAAAAPQQQQQQGAKGRKPDGPDSASPFDDGKHFFTSPKTSCIELKTAGSSWFAWHGFICLWAAAVRVDQVWCEESHVAAAGITCGQLVPDSEPNAQPPPPQPAAPMLQHPQQPAEKVPVV